MASTSGWTSTSARPPPPKPPSRQSRRREAYPRCHCSRSKIMMSLSPSLSLSLSLLRLFALCALLFSFGVCLSGIGGANGRWTTRASAPPSVRARPMHLPSVVYRIDVKKTRTMTDGVCDLLIPTRKWSHLNFARHKKKRE
jgi:hypothetical protein